MFVWIIFWIFTVFQRFSAAENETFPLLTTILPSIAESTTNAATTPENNKIVLPTTLATTVESFNLTENAKLIFSTMASMALNSTLDQALFTTKPVTTTSKSSPSTSSTTSTTKMVSKQYFPGRDPKYFLGSFSTATEEPLPEILTTITPKPTTARQTTPKFETYSPVPMPEIDNNVFREFTRLSKLTGYMIVDPKFAEDYTNDRLSNISKILYMVYGDVVKHIFATETLTQRQPPLRRNRIRYRMKSLNDKPPKSCTEAGRDTFRLFCPFSYGYQWWDCILPDEVCDGIPHCGLGEDEDPKMCLYFKAAVSKLEASHKGILLDMATGRQVAEKHVEIYDPDQEN